MFHVTATVEGGGMDRSEPLSKDEYLRLAERWRQLATDATTRQIRNRLLTLARQCEFLALGIQGEGNQPRESSPLDVSLRGITIPRRC
jgi:hypothetical protein